MFKILSKYEVMIPEDDEVKLEGLPREWVNFQQCLIDSTAMLKKHKVQCSVLPHSFLSNSLGLQPDLFSGLYVSENYTLRS